jgi:hypothetical protein
MTDTGGLDLIILVPGKDERETLDTLLSKRRNSLGIGEVRYEILVHPRRDPGCFSEAPDVLQPYINRARWALVLFDYEGSGQEQRSAEEVARDLEERLARSGWEDRAAVLVVRPELETWVWSDSSELDRIVGWQSRKPPLRQWMRETGRWPEGIVKPPRPKESFQEALRQVKMRRSSAIYRQLAESVSLERCSDDAFIQFKKLIRGWFAAGGPM